VKILRVVNRISNSQVDEWSEIVPAVFQMIAKIPGCVVPATVTQA
jgi:hypothetical protein